MKYTRIFSRARAIAAFCLAGYALAFPVDIKFVPLYDKSQLSFTGIRTIWMEEVPSLPKHFWVLGQEGAVYALYPTATGEYDNSSKRKILDFSKETLLILKSEFGAYGMAFHPKFPADPRVFVIYTAHENPNQPTGERGGFVKIDEYRVSGAKLDQLERTRNILSSRHGTSYGTSEIAFGADGYLLAFLGDYNVSSQDLESLNRKILRLDIDKSDPGRNYAIPRDNPFVNHANPNVKKEIWALGFRNTWRITVDPLTGDVWGADVGTNEWEEMNLVRSRLNYGWETGGNSIIKGFTGPCRSSGTADCTPFTDAEWNYKRTGSGSGILMNCIGAGAIYRADKNSPLYGHHIYFDVSSDILVSHKKGSPPVLRGRVNSLGGTGNSGHNGVSHINEDAYGQLYATLVSWDDNIFHEIYKVSHPDLMPSSQPVNVHSDSRSASRRHRDRKLQLKLDGNNPGLNVKDLVGGAAFDLEGRRVSP